MIQAGISGLTLLLLASSADAWGPDGHTIVAHVAFRLLDDAVSQVLRTELGGVDLNNASDWPDDYDHSESGRWSFGEHFINYPGQACDFIWKRDCADDYCNAGAVVNYTAQVFNQSLSKQARLEALEFVIHYLGDIHQPLHVASGDDRGGNTIEIAGNHFAEDPRYWQNISSNLHSQWDSNLVIESIYEVGRQLGFPIHYHKWQLLADDIWKRMDNEWNASRSAWQKTVASSSAEDLRAGMGVVGNETAAAGCTYAYSWADGTRVKQGEVLTREYFLRAKPVVEAQLAKGGARLAQVLGDAYAAAHSRVTIVV